MDRNEIEAKLKESIEVSLGFKQGTIQCSDSFIEDLGCDSLDMVELTMFVEEEFGIVIEDEESLNLVTVQDAIDLIAKGL